MVRVLSTVGALALIAASAGAQICEGTASFRSGHVRIGAIATGNRDSVAYGARIAVGGPFGSFFAVGASALHQKDVTSTGVAESGEAGVAIGLPWRHSVQLCPEVGAEYRRGPTLDLGGLGRISTSAHAYRFGASVGAAAFHASNVDFVPFAGAAYAIARSRLQFPTFARTADDGYGILDAGVGFVIGRVVTLRPSIEIPIGLPGVDADFGVALSISLGK